MNDEQVFDPRDQTTWVKHPQCDICQGAKYPIERDLTSLENKNDCPAHLEGEFRLDGEHHSGWILWIYFHGRRDSNTEFFRATCTLDGHRHDDPPPIENLVHISISPYGYNIINRIYGTCDDPTNEHCGYTPSIRVGGFLIYGVKDTTQRCICALPIRHIVASYATGNP